MMKKGFAFLLLLGVVLGTLIGCNSSEGNSQSGGSENDDSSSEGTAEAQIISVALTLSENSSLYETWEKFGEVVEAESDGLLTVEIYPNGEKGNDRESIEGVQVGTITATAPSTAPVAGFDETYSVFDLPFLFKDRETAYNVLDGTVGQEMLDRLENIGMKGLGYWENGYRNLTNSKLPVRTPEDVEGLKIRTMENNMHLETWKLLGANPTPMAWADVYVSLQQGALDGQENPLSIIYDQKVYEVNDYVTLTGHVYSPFVVLFNKQFYDGLSPDLQAAIETAMEEAKQANRQLVLEEEDEIKASLAETGMEVIELTAEEKAAFQEATLPIYDQFSDVIGAELVEQMLEAVK
ncbi:TRAP transporter substrate-binding protein [Alkalihalobacillus oceani]|uniref:TRAP transporter substrate-binding protein n=1 Tax=Halalkalibacter oceani TaxID=1653776 RepID=A0A9X2IR57_9BACI|nr:TRAP transporter substrate-binding protein [Halalkalibacter oceani]MCM3716122.1 TRAP transporter substrate-binding protein [Halalkalibacter oceani]